LTLAGSRLKSTNLTLVYLQYITSTLVNVVCRNIRQLAARISVEYNHGNGKCENKE